MLIRGDIEILRLFSAFGIVLFHSQTKGATIGYSGLIFFLVLSVFLSGEKSQIYKRARRLLVPWLLCVAFYGIVNVFFRNYFIPLENGLIAGILSGPQYHLWYLPFIFMVLVAIDGLKAFCPKALITYLGGVLVVVTLLFSPVWREPSIELGYPWSQYLQAMPGVFLGMFFWGYLSISRRYGLILLFIMLAVSLSNIPLSGIGLPYSIVIVVFSVVLFCPVPFLNDSNILAISSLSFGIYLIHPFFLMITRYLNISTGILAATAVFFTSGIVTWIFKKVSPIHVI